MVSSLYLVSSSSYFDFSIEEIKELLNDTPETVADKIQQKMEEYEDESEEKVHFRKCFSDTVRL